MFAEDGLGVELYAFGGQGAMAQSHDLAFGRARRDFKAFGDMGWIGDERVVAGGGEGGGDAAEDRLFVVVNGRCLSMQGARGADDTAAECLGDGLVAQAHAEDGELAAEASDDRHADAGLAWRTGAG